MSKVNRAQNSDSKRQSKTTVNWYFETLTLKSVNSIEVSIWNPPQERKTRETHPDLLHWKTRLYFFGGIPKIGQNHKFEM